MKAVIMAGGKGTRIASLDSTVPKPMLKLAGKPILEYQIECLKSQGIVDYIIVIGHLGHVIKDYFGSGEKWGINIKYVEENSPLGTAGSFYYLQEFISEDFLLVNGDIIFDIDLERFRQNHLHNSGIATIFTHPNDHPFDSGVIVADESCCVKKWYHKEEERTWYKNRVNAGIHILSPEVLYMVKNPEKTDLDRDILRRLIEDNQLFAYDSPEYVKDMGTPERFAAVEHDITSGLVSQKNLKNKQKALFLDRDGTINKYVGFLRNIDQFELIDGVAEKIKKMNQRGYLVIVVTNQPVIARGEVSWPELNNIHNKMETLLGQHGAYVNDIFICPHHPDSGFPGERIEYKIECDCRKPKPGLLLQAAEKYNIDLKQSYMVGDSDSDMEAGKAAGCICIKV